MSTQYETAIHFGHAPTRSLVLSPQSTDRPSAPELVRSSFFVFQDHPFVLSADGHTIRPCPETPIRQFRAHHTVRRIPQSRHLRALLVKVARA